MKTFTHLLLFSLLFSSTFALIAQPTLTRTANFPDVGDAFSRINCDTVGVSAGAAGANQTWNFSSLQQAASFQSGDFVLPSATDFASDFPSANIAEAYTGGSVNYFNATTAKTEIVGFVSVNQQGQASLVTFTNPQTTMEYPFTFGDSFTDDANRQYGTYNGTVTTQTTADGYGTITLPNGVFTNVLRTRTVVNILDTAPGTTFGIDDIVYEWWSTDNKQPIFSIRLRTLNQNGTISQLKYVDYANIQGAAGGPDAYGYTWTTSDGGLNCDWIDISSIGTQVTGLSDDNTVGPFNMGINFQYYWNTLNQVWVGSNGYVAFQSGVSIASGATGFPLLPTIDGNEHFVAPMLADFNFSGSLNPGRVYTYADIPNNRFIVSFINVPFWTNNTGTNSDYTTETNTFQVIFSAADSSITYQYQNMATAVAPEYATQASPVVVGLENSTGDIGIQISSAAIPTPNTCIRFDAPAVPLIAVYDVRPSWNQYADNGGFFIQQGSVTNLVSNISNSGSVALTSPINITTQIIDGNGGLFGAQQNNTISTGLVQGESQQVTVWTDFPAIQGNYTFQVEVQNTDDINPGNNLNISEMVVVDSLVNGEYYLDFSPNPVGGAADVVSWSGATDYSDGVGMYVKPPFYPMEVVAAEYICQPAQQATSITAGFRAQIVQTDANKVPTEVLSTKDVPAAEIPAGEWHRVTFGEPVRIDENGFFVTWLMQDTGISLATDPNPPYSRQTYEVLSNTYAPYRSREQSDFFIRAIVKKIHEPIVFPVGINNNNPVFAFINAYPNPATDQATITYQLNQNTNVRFVLTDVTGKTIVTKNIDNATNGIHQLSINTQNMPAGAYFYTITANGYSITKQLVVK